MNFRTVIVTLFVLTALVSAQSKSPLADNAALRYWSAFSAIQDSELTGQQVNQLEATMDGTIPYDDSKYKDLLEKNTLALAIMQRGTVLPNCDWGLDYGLAENLPVDYARKGLVLGRLNILYALHLLTIGNRDEGVRALVAGMKFSHDVSNGGSLFASIVAKDLLVNHLRVMVYAVQQMQLSASQKSQLRESIARLGDGLDWRIAAQHDLEALRGRYAADPSASATLSRIQLAYAATIDDASKLPLLKQSIGNAPQQLAKVIPNPDRVLEQKQELNNRLQQTLSLLR